MKRLVMLVAVGLMACGGGGDDDGGGGGGGGPCQLASGVYSFTLSERPGGTCGPSPERIVTKPATNVPASCEGGSTYSGDNCTETISSLCSHQTAGGPVVFEEGAIIGWDKAGAVGTGIWQGEVYDVATGVLLCRSTYDAAFTKL